MLSMNIDSFTPLSDLDSFYLSFFSSCLLVQGFIQMVKDVLVCSLPYRESFYSFTTKYDASCGFFTDAC